MDLSQKVAFNTLIQIFSKTTTVVFGLLTTILLTGYLGREGYGGYMFIITLVVMFGVFADWGTATIGVREAAKRKKDQGRIFANIFLFRLALACLAALLMFLAAVFLPLPSGNQPIIRQGIMLASIVLVLFATKASFGIIFQTKLQMEKLAVADIASSFLVLLLSWFFIRQQWGILMLIGAVVMANIVAVLIAWVLASRTIKFDFRWDKVFIKQLIRESLPMGAILLVFTIDNKIDTVMLGSMKGSGAVGIYAIAYRVYDVLILGAAYFMAVLLPVLSQYAAKTPFNPSPIRDHSLKRIYQKAFDVLLLMGVGATLFAWTFAPLIVRILTQQRFIEFGDSVMVLRILALALFLSYFNHLAGYTIVALGKQRPYFFVALAALVFNFLANLLVIPFWSYQGAAVVTVFTEGLVLMITSFLIFRLIGVVPSFLKFPKTAVQIIKQKGKIF